MKRTRTSVPALIRALGFITARQLEARLPKLQTEPTLSDSQAPTETVQDPPLVRATRRAPPAPKAARRQP